MQNEKIDRLFLGLTYYSILSLSFFLFISFSLSAIHHLFLAPAGIYFFVKSLKKRNFLQTKSQLALIFFVLVCVASIFANWEMIKEPARNLFKLKYYIIPIFGLYALREWGRKSYDQKKVRLIFHLLFIGASIATISGLIGLWTGFNPLRLRSACHETRACGMYGMYMSYGYGISLFSSLLAVLVVHRKKFGQFYNQKLLFFTLFISLLGLYFSGARGAWLGFLGSLPFLYFHQDKKRFFLIAFAASTLLGSLYFFSPRVKEAFINRGESNSQRITFWKGALAAFQERPILGYGHKNYEPYSKEIKTKNGIGHRSIQGHAHSNFFESLATTGILGFLCFLFFQIFWFYESPLFSAFVASFFISGQVQVTWGDGENVFLIMFVWMVSSFFGKDGLVVKR